MPSPGGNAFVRWYRDGMGDRQDHASTAGVIDAFEAATRAIAGLQSVDDVLQVIVDQVT